MTIELVQHQQRWLIIALIHKLTFWSLTLRKSFVNWISKVLHIKLMYYFTIFSAWKRSNLKCWLVVSVVVSIKFFKQILQPFLFHSVTIPCSTNIGNKKVNFFVWVSIHQAICSVFSAVTRPVALSITSKVIFFSTSAKIYNFAWASFVKPV